ncbi:MAG: tetratricopeptide repeat protein, partial [Isosphaeraceae bacterium]
AYAYSMRGHTWFSKQQYDKAIADYNEAIRLDPKDAYAYSMRGHTWFSKQQYEKAIADFIESIRLDPKDESTYISRAMAWALMHEPRKAIADLEKAIRLRPDDARAHHFLSGELTMLPGGTRADHEKAVALARRACELTGWKDPLHLEALAAAYASLKDYDSAIEWQKKANQLFTDPHYREMGEKMLKLYEKLKEGSERLKELRMRLDKFDADRV